MNNARARFFGLCAGLFLATPALAHPHVWVDVVTSAIFNEEGQVEAIQIQWTYDDFYSLLILEERGLDPDGDGALTEGEEEAIRGFDMNWPDWSDGDSYALLGEAPIAMGRPQQATARLQAGRLVSSHVRYLDRPLRPTVESPLIVQSYTPDYYVAYTVLDGRMQGAATGCEVAVHGFDPDLADAAILAATQEYEASSDPDVEFPKIGAAYSDEVRITCQPQ